MKDLDAITIEGTQALYEMHTEFESPLLQTEEERQEDEKKTQRQTKEEDPETKKDPETKLRSGDKNRRWNLEKLG